MPVVQLNYDIDAELHRRAKTCASHKGQTLKRWLEFAILEAVERQEAEWEADQEKRRRRH